MSRPTNKSFIVKMTAIFHKNKNFYLMVTLKIRLIAKISSQQMHLVLKKSFQGARWKPNPQSLSYLHLKTLLIWIKALNLRFDLVPDYTRSIDTSCKFSRSSFL